MSNERSGDQLVDSQTLLYYLQGHVRRLPGRTTMMELINAVSAQTRSFMLDKQLELVLGEELDDLKEQTIDSTDTAANSAFPPTDP